jgi:DNA-binding response OmpR family regulator
MRLLLISSSLAEGAYLNKALRESAHSLHATDDIHEALHVASQDMFDIVVIVAGEPAFAAAMSDVLPEFTQMPGSPSIVVVLGRALPPERAEVLRAGADACFVQPYSFIEMHEHMLALSRAASSRSAGGQGSSPSLKLDALTHELVEADRRVTVTAREYLLIECLLRKANVPVARDQLIRYAWPDKDDVDPSSVTLAVSRLRRKLDHHSFVACVETVNGYGYRLNTP